MFVFSLPCLSRKTGSGSTTDWAATAKKFNALEAVFLKFSMNYFEFKDFSQFTGLQWEGDGEAQDFSGWSRKIKEELKK